MMLYTVQMKNMISAVFIREFVVGREFSIKFIIKRDKDFNGAVDGTRTRDPRRDRPVL